jgi:hypothetical protein
VNRTTIARFLLPTLIVVVLIGTTFSPDARPTLVQAFGESPFGLPVTIVVAFAQLILFLPLLWVLYHLVRIAEQALKDGNGIGKIGLLIYITSVGQRHPELRRSQIVCLLGLLYFVAICAAWISYASMRGI